MKRLTRPLIIFILGALTILLLARLGNIDPSDFSDFSTKTLRHIRPGYLIMAIIIHYSGFVVRGLRWQLLLRGLGYSLSYMYTTALLMAGWFVSALVPARLGDVARASMLRRDHKISLAQGLASIATERALDILTILFLATLAALWALPGRTPPWIWQTISGGILFCVIALIILITTPNLETWLRNRFTRPPYQNLISFIFELLGSVRRLGQKPGLLMTVGVQSLYIWLCDVFLMYFIFLSIGAAPPFSISAFTSMIVDLAAAVPIMPGAIGQFEGTAVGVLSLFNISLQQSSLMVILNRFVSFWSFIIVSGLITYLFGFAQALNPEALGVKQTV